MLVGLQKDAKQCCDATKLDCTLCTCQFTPKMKANAIPRLLSPLALIDSGVVSSQHCLASFWTQNKHQNHTGLRLAIPEHQCTRQRSHPRMHPKTSLQSSATQHYAIPGHEGLWWGRASSWHVRFSMGQIKPAYQMGKHLLSAISFCLDKVCMLIDATSISKTD